jgi:hypothetical protein
MTAGGSGVVGPARSPGLQRATRGLILGAEQQQGRGAGEDQRIGQRGPLIVPEWALRHRHGSRPGAPGTASRLVHAGMHRETLGQAGDGKNPQHLVMRARQPRTAPDPAGEARLTA